MSFDLGTLSVKLSADAGELNKGLREAMESVEKTAKKFKRAAREVAMVGAEMAALGGEAIHAATKHNPAAAKAMEQLKKSLEAIAAEAGMALLPVLQKVGDAVKQVADWFRALDPHLKQNVARYAAIVAGALLAVGVLGELSGVVAGMAGIFNLVAGAVSLLMGPVGLVLLAVASLVAYVIVLRKAWQTNLFGIRDYVLSVAKTMSNAWEEVKQGFSESLTGIAQAFTGIFNVAIIAVSVAVNFILTALDKVIELAQRASDAAHMGLDFSGARQAVSGAQTAVSPDALKGYLSSGASKLGGGASAAASGVASGVRAVKDKAVQAGKDAANWTLDAFKDAAAQVKSSIVGLLGSIGLIGGHSKALARTSDIVKPEKTYAIGEETSQRIQTSGNTHRVGQTSMAFNNANAGAAIDVSEIQAAFKQSADDAIKRIFGSGTIGQVAKTAVDAGIRFVANVSEALHTIVGKLADGARTFAAGMKDAILNGTGVVGEAIKSAIAGFQSGGIWGAIGAVLAQLLSHSRVFMNLINMASFQFQKVADVLGSLFSGLQPLIGALDMVNNAFLGMLAPIFKVLGQVIGAFAPIIVIIADVFQGLSPIFQLLGSVVQMFASVLTSIAQVLFDVYQVVGEGVLYVLLAIENFWNGVVSTIDQVLNTLAAITIDLGPLGKITPFSFLANALAGLAIDTSGTSTALNNLKNTSYGAAMAQANNTAAQEANTTALDKATESLTNVPEGFKVAIARFSSIAAGQGQNIYTGTTPGYDSQGNPTTGQSSGTGGGSGFKSATKHGGSSGKGGGGTVVYVTIVSEDPATIWKKLEPYIQRKAYVRRGTFARAL